MAVGLRRNKISVMLATEGTYPFSQGGVSTWANALVNRLTGIDYVIYSIVMNPFITLKYQLPESASLIKVPLWGTEEPSEHIKEIPFSRVYESKRRTTPGVVKEYFLPLFKGLLAEILSKEKDPQNLGNLLYSMHTYFQTYDYRNSFKAEPVWETFKQAVINQAHRDMLLMPSIFDLTQSLGWLYRFLVIVNTPIPRTDVSHSAAAAFCGLPCVLAKIKNRTPLLLTEHGVYLREQYLAASKRELSSYLKTFFIGLLRSVSLMNYHFADQVSPVCSYNVRWEKELGTDPKKIQVIYNGVDPAVFATDRASLPRLHPTVVAVARVDPVKDLVTLMNAAVLVKQQIPDVRFIVYGSVTVPEYYEECLETRSALGLEETFIFAGHTEDVAAAYRAGDVIALSSITEAFPYSVVEAMMSGKAVVATDVGGIKEALANCGLVVKPRNPAEMARALLSLLQDPDMRLAMGEDARERALTYFTIERAVGLYLDSYKALARGKEDLATPAARRARQMLLAQRAYAFAASGLEKHAVKHFRQAIQADLESPAVPVLLAEVARVYSMMGETDLALNELDKAQAMAELIESRGVA